MEDVKLELKGTEQIFHSEIPEAEIIGTAATETEFWKLMRAEVPQLVLLDLGLGGSTTVGVDICRQLKSRYPSLRVLVFTGEVLNERLWVEVLAAGADGIILKTGNLLERDDVMLVMHGRRYVFNEPFLEKVIARFRAVPAPPGTGLHQGDDSLAAPDALRHQKSGEASGRPHQPSLPAPGT